MQPRLARPIKTTFCVLDQRAIRTNQDRELLIRTLRVTIKCDYLRASMHRIFVLLADFRKSATWGQSYLEVN